MKTLLVVDDEVQVRRAWSRHARFAFEILSCASCAETLAAIPSRAGLAGMMIDVHLHDGSGLDLLEQLRAPFPAVPTAVVSGDPDPRISERASSLGADFIAKPMQHGRLDEFLNRVASLDAKAFPALQRAIYLAAQRWELRPHETVVLGALLTEVSREGMTRSLGVNVNTLKSRIAAVLDPAASKLIRWARQN